VNLAQPDLPQIDLMAVMNSNVQALQSQGGEQDTASP
jgi:hypothetical protein